MSVKKWVMSDEWWVMSDEWWVMSDGNWVMEIKVMLPNECEKMSDEWWVMSDEWWVMEIEWRKLSDEKLLTKQAQACVSIWESNPVCHGLLCCQLLQSNLVLHVVCFLWVTRVFFFLTVFVGFWHVLSQKIACEGVLIILN